jgi:argonaute-like protein implicated in RNA metabolism and viral defense
MKLYGSILSPPQLRFSYSSTFAISSDARKGLKQFGPYDAAMLPQSQINCGLIYPSGMESLKQSFITGLKDGEGYYPGFDRMFRIPLSMEVEQEIRFGSELEVRRAINTVISQPLDLVFVISPAAGGRYYSMIKRELLGNGIPSQVVMDNKIQPSDGRQWVLENLALASYAKIGGTPWVVANPERKNQLILGVSRAQDKMKKFLVGFVTVFTSEGDFLMMHSGAPVIEWEQYADGLRSLILEAVEEYQSKKGMPEEIILHFHKKPGERELRAIESALKSLGKSIPYALMHLNDGSNFRLFDSTSSTFIPEAGLRVDLSRHESIILLDGLVGGRRRRQGVPNVLDISMDKRSTLPDSEFARLTQQVFNFSRLNWRGFNSTAAPVTLLYSKLISKMMIEVGTEHWNQIVASGKLRDKSWFL